MLDVMSERGPDSAGFAVYGAGAEGEIKLTLRMTDEPAGLAAGFAGRLRRARAAGAQEPATRAVGAPRPWMRRCAPGWPLNYPDIHIVGTGTV